MLQGNPIGIFMCQLAIFLLQIVTKFEKIFKNSSIFCNKNCYISKYFHIIGLLLVKNCDF